MSESADLGNSTKQPADRPPERRRFGRRSVFKHAFIAARGAEPVDCIVIDLSPDSARLRLDGILPVPNRFDLVIEEDDFSVRCEVARREAEEIAVRFMGSPRRLSWLGRRSRIAASVASAVRKATE